MQHDGLLDLEALDDNLLAPGTTLVGPERVRPRITDFNVGVILEEESPSAITLATMSDILVDSPPMKRASDFTSFVPRAVEQPLQRPPSISRIPVRKNN